MSIPAISHYLEPFAAIGKCSNLGLASDKLVAQLDEPEDKSHHKNKALDFRSSFKLQGSGNGAYQIAFERHERCLSECPDAVLVEIKSTTPTMLGTGNPNVHEAGLNLLRPWGVPFIHGSTLKGALSAYLAAHSGDEWKLDEKGKSDLQLQLFGGAKGNDSYIGNVCFTDGWVKPRTDSWFQGDIITPHHKLYYSDTQHRFPDGMENPNPIQISVLKPGLTFQFFLVGPENECRFLKSVLKSALTEQGLGGKTAVGYGRFEVLASEQEKRDAIRNASPEQLVKMWQEKPAILEGHEELFKDALRNIPCSEANRSLMIKLFPAHALLCELKKQKPEGLKGAGKIRDKIVPKLKGDKVDSSDPDCQSVFNYCVDRGWVRKREAVEGTWLEAFAYGWENVTLNDDTVETIIESLDDRQWPPKEEFVDALEKVCFRDEELRELCLELAREKLLAGQG